MSFRPALLALALLITGCGSESPADDAAAQKKNGAATKAALVQRADFTLDDYRGDVVLLNFWATWCAPCRAEMPDLVEIQKEMGKEGLQIVGVAVDRQGREVVAPYLEQQPVNYPIVLDPEGEIGDTYGGIPALPTTLVIGTDGEVRGRIVGRVRAEALRERLKGVLHGRSSEADSSAAAQNAGGTLPDFIKSATTLPPPRSPSGSARARS